MIYKTVNYSYIKQDKKLPAIMTFINKIPICELIYIFSIGMTFQLRVRYPYLTNRFVHRMMNVGSAGRSDIVAKNFAGMIMGLQ